MNKLTFPRAFAGFFLFYLSLVFVFTASLLVVLALFSPDISETIQMESIVAALSVYTLLVIGLALLSPLWGKRIIGALTGTSPGYGKIFLLALLLPFALSIVAGAALGVLFGDGALGTGFSLLANLGAIAFASKLYADGS